MSLTKVHKLRIQQKTYVIVIQVPETITTKTRRKGDEQMFNDSHSKWQNANA